MLSALVDESTVVYIALILLCSGLLFAWRRTRKWQYLAATGFGFVLVLAFAILTQLLVTDRQKAEALARLDRAFESTEVALGGVGLRGFGNPGGGAGGAAGVGKKKGE